jgi:hypothetical protein
MTFSGANNSPNWSKSHSKKIQTYITSVNAHRINCGRDFGVPAFLA